MSFGSYSTTPASNISINGINIAENCPASNVNDCLRQFAADGRELYNTVVAIDVSTRLSTTGGTMTGNITRSGGGSHLYHGHPFAGGAVYVQNISVALDSGVPEGTMVFQYE
jgi:hypothetical protein